MTLQGPSVFHRIVKTNPPTRRDFLSHKALGIPLRHPTPRALRLSEGVSVYRTKEQAAALATISPHLGRYVAELRVSETDAVRYELDNGRNGHCTLWADPDVLLALVVTVTPVEGYTVGVWYELWAVESGNLLEDFATEAEALTAVRAYLTPDESSAMVDIALVIYEDELPVRSVRGPDLAALAGLPAHHPARRSA